MSQLLTKMQLSRMQRQQVEQVFGAMQQEYCVRRKMLIERAKVTLQSMLWSTEWLQAQGTAEQAATAAQRGQDAMHEEPAVQLNDLYNARIGEHNPAATVLKVLPSGMPSTNKLVLWLASTSCHCAFHSTHDS